MTSKNSKKSQKGTETKSRTEAGEVSCTTLEDGSLRLNIPGKHCGKRGKQAQKRLGLKATPENRAIADLIKALLNERIKAGNFDVEELDEYVDEYKRCYLRTNSEPTTSSSRLAIAKGKNVTLDKLWEEHCRYKKSFLSATTFRAVFYNVGLHINKLTTKDLDQADTIVVELRQNTKSYAVMYRSLQYFSSCCEWAVDKGKASKNPFKRILEDLPQPQTDDAHPDPFTSEGMERVIAAYEKHSRYSHYAPFIKFRYKIGCRIGEAVGLKWKHVNWKEGYIEFCETITHVSGEFIHAKGTKTELSRKVPIKDGVRRILEAQKPANVDPEQYVFRDSDGGHIRYPRFLYSWYGEKNSPKSKDGTKKQYFVKGIVSKLAELSEEEGGIDHYRPPYSTRHTFITEALDKLARRREVKLSDVAQLAAYLGTSPDTIFEHYLGLSGDDSIMDIDEDEAVTVAHSQGSSLSSENTSTQLFSAYQLIEQLTQQLSQLTQQNQALQEQITQQNQTLQQQMNQLLSLQIPHQQNTSSQPLQQSEPISTLEPDLGWLTLLLALDHQLQGEPASD